MEWVDIRMEFTSPKIDLTYLRWNSSLNGNFMRKHGTKDNYEV